MLGECKGVFLPLCLKGTGVRGEMTDKGLYKAALASDLCEDLFVRYKH